MDSLTNLDKHLQSVLNPNDKIEIAFDSPVCQDLYKSRVAEISLEEVTINVTTETHLPLNSTCWAIFSYMDQRYSFETTVKGYREDSPELMVLQYPVKIQLSERREFLRVPVGIVISFCVSGGSKENYKETLVGTAKNMSASGILLAADVKLEDKNDILMSFDLEDESTGQVFLKVRDLKGRIIRGFKLEHKIAGEAYTYGIKFREISDPFKEDINRFIVRRQIVLKKRK